MGSSSITVSLMLDKPQNNLFKQSRFFVVIIVGIQQFARGREGVLASLLFDIAIYKKLIWL